MLYSDIDVHKKFTHVVVKIEKDEVIKEDEIKAKEDNIERFFEVVEEQFEVAIEATRNYEFFNEVLEDLASRAQ